ncbi:unnamed protein product [Cunninghamella echinulata]
MKFVILFAIPFAIVQAQCPNCTNKCLRDCYSRQYECVDPNNYKNAACYGTRRKCNVPEPSECKPSDSFVGDPSQCCIGIASPTFVGPGKPEVLQCSLNNCDLSDGCRSSLDCPGKEDCINAKCVTLTPGVQCGECGKAPIQGQCCEGTYHDGVCLCASSDDICSGESDCIGKGDGHWVCCDGRCKKDTC